MAVPKVLTRLSRAITNSLYQATGSGSGSAKEPQWFKNLRRADDAEIQVGSRRLAVHVDVVEGAQRELLWHRLLVHAPFFGDYQRKVRRQIPMAILTPKPDVVV